MSLESRLKGFNKIYHSTHSDDYLSHLILRENKNKREYKVPLHFQRSEQKTEVENIKILIFQ